VKKLLGELSPKEIKEVHDKLGGVALQNLSRDLSGKEIKELAEINKWSTTTNLSSIENAVDHWKRHGSEFPNTHSAKEYIQRAQEFVANPPSTALVKVRANGDTVIWDPVSDTFAVKTATGEPRTMFVPNPATHGYPTNRDYFNAQ
jgi:filamentous hemagglutinin